MVEGEISNLNIYPSSGHAYFSLKDDGAVLNCVMWRDQVRRLKFRPENGQQVICTGKITVYERSGKLQLSVVRIEHAGVGALQAAYRQLAEKLRKEGLTDPNQKKELPLWPKTIGVVSSLQAAALKDILRTIYRRDQKAHVIIAPTPVQGDGAAPKIAQALKQLDQLALTDVILLARGGGSVEDLWCFNEEVVARAIANCDTPIVTGIGHETDTTIADLVADRAASTPTAAAELSVPLRSQLLKEWHKLESELHRGLYIHIEQKRRELSALSDRLQDPRSLMRRKSQEFDELQNRAELALRRRIRQEQAKLAGLNQDLMLHSPKSRFIQTRSDFINLVQRQETSILAKLAQSQLELGRCAERLDLLSPLSILGRGYSIATNQAGRAVRKSHDVAQGEKISIRLHEGTIGAIVETLDH